MDTPRLQESNEISDHILERGLTAARLKVLVPEREKVMREMTSIERIFEGKGGKSEITEDMIERARAHPIEDLIELRRKTALCPFHPDRNPSMGIKNNRSNVLHVVQREM